MEPTAIDFQHNSDIPPGHVRERVRSRRAEGYRERERLRQRRIKQAEALYGTKSATIEERVQTMTEILRGEEDPKARIAANQELCKIDGAYKQPETGTGIVAALSELGRAAEAVRLDRETRRIEAAPLEIQAERPE